MAILLVTYEPQRFGDNERRVSEYLTKFPYWRQLDSAWLVDTGESVEHVRDQLQQLADGQDVVFVAQLERNWASINYPGAGWLNDSARRW
jgi:hypothetical protein